MQNEAEQSLCNDILLGSVLDASFCRRRSTRSTRISPIRWSVASREGLASLVKKGVPS